MVVRRREPRLARRGLCAAPVGGGGVGAGGPAGGRRRKQCLSARERNVRRIESNERERLRMHGLNEAFQVSETRE